MTYTPADIGLSPEAAPRLDTYLGQVRAALAGAADINPDEIDADIREHVENELHGAPRPVSVVALEEVLTKLGPPSQWGAAPDPTAFRRAKQLLGEGLRGVRIAAVERAKRIRFLLWNGPEDWRLPYLSFGVFAVGALTVFVFPIALLISYFLSRAGLAVAKEKGIDVGAGRRWLLYPPVVIVSMVLLVKLVAWPAVFGGIAAEEVSRAASRVIDYDRPDPPNASRVYREETQRRRARLANQVEEDRKLLATIPASPYWAPAVAGLFVGLGALAIWWTVLGFVSARFPGAVRATFFPLCDRFERSHGSWLGWTCLALSVGWCVAAWKYVSDAGLM